MQLERVEVHKPDGFLVQEHLGVHDAEMGGCDRTFHHRGKHPKVARGTLLFHEQPSVLLTEQPFGQDEKGPS